MRDERSGKEEGTKEGLEEKGRKKQGKKGEGERMKLGWKEEGQKHGRKLALGTASQQESGTGAWTDFPAELMAGTGRIFFF